MELGQIRQGDVLLIPVEGLPPPPEARPSNEAVLAVGEMTGHAHRLQAPEVYAWCVGDQRYVRVEKEVGTLQHEEHDPVPAAVVVPGVTYRVVTQQEWNLQEERQVITD